ncbi:chemotaxis-specific protein-glutamate methyltransferase CheB, partial [Kaarinaea lacus]
HDVPDLILMDLIMPEMNGVEATEKIMQSTPCPILIVTASVTQNSSLVFEAMGKGAIDAISTPLFAGNGQTEASESLLNKVSMIGVLSRPAVDLRNTVNNIRFADNDYENQIVAIGSSSGGPMALSRILNGLPAEFPAGIVVVQHVDEQFSHGLAEWLNKQTLLDVRIAKPGDRPRKGQVLLAGTNDHLVMSEKGMLMYQKEPVEMPYRPSVDVFWHSLCKYWRGDITAVLLTGMGRDGAQGMLELLKRGAYTIAQDEKSCAVYGMPKAAVELNAASEVVPIDEIAKKLCAKFSKIRVSVK